MKSSSNTFSFRGLVTNIFLAFLTLLLCLFAFEIILRFTIYNNTYILNSKGVKIRDFGTYVISYANSNRIIENTEGVNIEYITNADGLRDYDYKITKSRGIFRIIGLGDSFAYGAGVPLEDSFLKILEKILNKKTSGKQQFEVLNLGMRGFGQKQMFKSLKEIGMKYQPDLVLLSFYVGNDLNDNMKSVKTKNIELEVKQKGLINYPFKKKWLKKNIKVAAFLKDKWTDFRLGVGPSQYGKKKLFVKEYPRELEEAFKLTEDLIVEIVDFLKPENIELCVIIIPMKFQVDFNRKYKEKYREDNIIIDKPQRTLRKILERNLIPYIELLEFFQEESEHKNKDLYLKGREIHWNSAGNHLTAEEVYRQLVIKKLIPISTKN